MIVNIDTNIARSITVAAPTDGLGSRAIRARPVHEGPTREGAINCERSLGTQQMEPQRCRTVIGLNVACGISVGGHCEAPVRLEK